MENEPKGLEKTQKYSIWLYIEQYTGDHKNFDHLEHMLRHLGETSVLAEGGNLRIRVISDVGNDHVPQCLKLLNDLGYTVTRHEVL